MGKISINVYLPESLHSEIRLIAEIGISLSSIARLGLRKYRSENLAQWPMSLTGKLRRVILYLDQETEDVLNEIADREKLKRSEVLRRVMIKYVDDHKNIIKMLI